MNGGSYGTRETGVTLRDGAWRRQRLEAAHLYLCVGIRDGLEGFLDAVLAAGVDLVQLRDKDASERDLWAAAEVFRVTASRHEALFVLNDYPALAREVGADGVHVGQEDPVPGAARAAVGPDAVIGRSTHSRQQIDRALDEDCDYFSVGPVEETPTKAGRPGTGLGPVRHAAAVADRPWFVTGGMSVDTAPTVLDLGAHGIVVVRAIVDADEPAAVARSLRDLFPGREDDHGR